MGKKNKKINKIKKFKKKDINTVTTVKIRVCMFCMFVVLFALIFRIGFLQFVQGADLKEKAYKQQTVNKLISAKRGNILDSTGKVLATSAQVDTVSINPTKITGKTEKETKEKKESLAKALSEIFELDYEETLSKVNSNSSIQTIAKKVEQDKIDKLKTWMEENKISVGINIDEDTKRYYPYNNLAAYVIGFCNSENQGIYGVERSYNSYLTGTPGKIVTSTDVHKDEISDENGKYIEAENGNNIVLTIDANIQGIAEKYLKEAVELNNAHNGNVIIMNPNNGDVLAMAQYPDYDLNTPFTPTTQYWIDRWDSLSSSDKTEMYRNIMVSSRYDPGSTFKLIGASVALEENITTTDVQNDFSCIGYEMFAEEKVKCTGIHGNQTLRKVLENSCNPGMMQLASRIGKRSLYKYYNAYGLFAKTGVGLPEEINSYFYDESKIVSAELATMIFGQGIQVTPMQLITSISAIANDGILMKPKIVKQIINTDNNAVTNIEDKEIRQVISKETASEMLDMMESVVNSAGSGSKGSVRGYSIGGKTGTSEPPKNHKEYGYVASFVAVAPAENPEVVILVTIYDPHVENYHGGHVAGPVVSKILSEVLPYLGISPDKIYVGPSSGSNSTVTVPNVENKTVAEAQKNITNAGLRCNFNLNGNKNEVLVTDQVPEAGTKLPNNSLVMLYTEENNVRTSTTVPNLSGMTASQAASSLKSKNLNINIEGSRYCKITRTCKWNFCRTRYCSKSNTIKLEVRRLEFRN